ncbi:MAG: hemin uptake protein HemP [Rubripirellula sp.]
MPKNPEVNEPSKPDAESRSDSPMLRMPKVISFNSLAPCGDEIWIENNGQLYRLRRTSQGKLILTK